MRGSYLHHKTIKAAQGIKISAQNLEYAVAGTQMYVVGQDDDIEELKEEAMSDMTDIFSSVDRSGAQFTLILLSVGCLFKSRKSRLASGSEDPLLAGNICCILAETCTIQRICTGARGYARAHVRAHRSFANWWDGACLK